MQIKGWNVMLDLRCTILVIGQVCFGGEWICLGLERALAPRGAKGDWLIHELSMTLPWLYHDFAMALVCFRKEAGRVWVCLQCPYKVPVKLL